MYPYNPTQIFKATASGTTYIYVIEPPSSSSENGHISLYNTSDTITSDQTTSINISESLPFLQSNGFAYNIAQSVEGDLYAISGNCSATSTSSSLWKFLLSNVTSSDKQSWLWDQFDASRLGAGASLTGPMFLSPAFAFTPQSDEDSTMLYTFGGACPDYENPSPEPIGSASYSDQMLAIVPETTTRYEIVGDPINSPPIAEAGSTITALLPSYSMNSDGSQATGQDFVLIGGNTQTAFINMTQLAIFTLPQGQWSFISVNVAASATPSTNNDPPLIEPRSGHTATLTESGDQIVVLGGWVANTSTPATPELVVLDLGVGYGGSGGWSWWVPNVSNSPFANGQGLYGHGAIMLPGDVMMVTGGSLIEPEPISSTKRKRNTGTAQNYFFNVTSGAWLSSYHAINPQSPLVSPSQTTSLDGADKAGLGIGLAFGILALIGACVAGYFYWKKMKWRRTHSYEQAIGEKEIKDLSSVARTATYDPVTDQQVYDSGARPVGSESEFASSRPWTTSAGSGLAINRWGMREVERSDSDLVIPMPQIGPRRIMKPNYAPGLARNLSKFGRPTGMYAIEERSEEGSSAPSSRKPSGTKATPLRSFSSRDDIDPFQDPSNVIEGIPEESNKNESDHLIEDIEIPNLAEEMHKEMTEWIKDWVTVDEQENGQKSPASSDPAVAEIIDDRTVSSLSEKSRYSHLSSNWTVSRATSTNSGRTLAQIPQLRPQPYHDEPVTTSSSSGSPGRASLSRPGTAEADGDSFITAHSVNSGYLTGMDTIYAADDDLVFSRRQGTSTNRYRSMGVVGGIVGSVKRAIPKALNIATGSSTARSISLTGAVARPIVIGEDGYYDYSPTKEEVKQLSNPPTTQQKLEQSCQLIGLDASAVSLMQRSVSDGGAEAISWNSPEPASDWSHESSMPAKRDRDETQGIATGRQFGSVNQDQGSRSRGTNSIRSGKSRQSDFSDDWDVEAAVEERVVQIMFTVPREKLRVVNADPKGDAENDLDSD